jgi:hypothetical protein
MDSEIPHAPPRPRRRWRRILALQALFVVGGLLAVEGVGRVVLWARGHPWSATQAQEQLQRARVENQAFDARAATDWFQTAKENPAAQPHLHPYYAWETGVRDAQIDAELNYRKLAKGQPVYNVLILGGSVAEMFAIQELGWDPLREVLKADPRLAGKALRVMPFARGGGKQPQQILRLCFLISIGLAPDGVIELDGFNEVALGNKNATVGVHPLFPSAPHWAFYASAGVSDKKGLDLLLDLRVKQQAVDAACDRSLAWHLDHSAVLGTLALRRVRALKSEFGACQEACTRYLTALSSDVVSGPAFEGGAKEAVAESVRCWLQTSLTMQDICRARSIHYLHVLQPTLYDTGSKTLTEKELAGSLIDPTWKEGVQRGYPLMRQAGKVLREHDVNFFDATQVFADVKDDIYYDCCHFAKKGNRILAQAIGRAFLDSMPAAK